MAPVRGSREANLQSSRSARGDVAPKTVSSSVSDVGSNGKSEEDDKTAAAAPPRLNKETMSNREYFRAWDKFDVEKEVEAIDKEEEAAQTRAREAREGARAREEKNRLRRAEELASLRSRLNFSSMSPKEREWMSSREKNKGNECFRAGENEDALLYYSRSLALDECSSVVYANRAMANIRLANFEAAVSDCTRALEIDPTYTKALSRRGMVHHRAGRYSLAEDDFQSCVSREPANKDFAALLARSQEKRKDVEGEATHQMTKKKVMIQELSDDDDDEEEILEMGADGFDISAEEEKKKKDKEKKAAEKKKAAAAPKPAAKPTPSAPATFKKVAIQAESDSDSEEDDKKPSPAAPATKKVLAEQKPTAAATTPATTTAQQQQESDKLKDSGNACMSSSDFDKAVDFYTQAISAWPDNAAALNNRALAYLKLKDGAAALKDSDRCVALLPMNLKAVFRRGLAHAMLGEQGGEREELEGAYADFAAVLAKEPDNAEAAKELEAAEGKLELLRLAEDDSDDNDDGQLRVEAKSKSNSSPNDSPSNSLGFTKLSLEEIDDAKKAVLSPTNSAASPSAAAKSPSPAMTTRIAIQADSDSEEDEPATIVAAAAAAATTATAAATPTTEKTSRIQIDEDDEDDEDDEPPPAKVTTDKVGGEKAKSEGNDLLKEGKLEQAVAKYDLSLKLDPENLASMNNKSLALLKLKKFDDAMAAASSVLAKEPDNVKALFRKASAISGKGSAAGAAALKEAVVLFDKCKSLGGEGGDDCKERVACVKALQSLEGSSSSNKAASSSPAGNAPVAAAKVVTSPPPAKAADQNVAKRVEAAMQRNLAAAPVLPSKMPAVPKTTSEMEVAIRSLKADTSGEYVSAYLGTFDQTTYKKTFKDSMDPDLLSVIFLSLDKTFDAEPERNIKVLNGISKVAAGLNVVFMVLDDAAKNAVKNIIKKIDARGDKVTCQFYTKSFKGLL